MKNIICLLGLVFIFGCSKEFLNKPPLDQVTDGAFFTVPENLKTYMNHFYPVFYSYKGRGRGIYSFDFNSDNMAREIPDSRLAGLLVPPNDAGRSHYDETWYTKFDVAYNFDWIRDVNIFLAKYTLAKGSWDEIKQYVGEARFFRAYLYFDLLKSYGDVPWISKPLTPESKELYSPRISRSIIADSILNDCDSAIQYLYKKGSVSASRLNKEIALLLKSRVALYEGTWEKYHKGSAFGVEKSRENEYLRIAAEAAKQLIDMHSYRIYNSGHPNEDYQVLFNQIDFSGNPEIMLWKRYSISLDLLNNSQMGLIAQDAWLGYGGVTKWLTETYLCTDGLPISVSSLYRGDHTLENVVTNRDPRLGQTIFKPGDAIEIKPGNDTAQVFTKPTFNITFNSRTGYRLKKGLDPHNSLPGNNRGEYAQVLFRYAECLLNYAEAKAELGTVTQKDIDETINVLRDRVNMPHLEINNITADPDWRFPTLSPIINEVRRERRVELACEGFRMDDLMRMAAAGLFIGKKPQGVFYHPSDYPTVKVGKDIFVDNQGYVDIYQKILPTGFRFNPGRDYLLPIPINELTLNAALKQNPGW